MKNSDFILSYATCFSSTHCCLFSLSPPIQNNFGFLRAGLNERQIRFWNRNVLDFYECAMLAVVAVFNDKNSLIDFHGSRWENSNLTFFWIEVTSQRNFIIINSMSDDGPISNKEEINCDPLLTQLEQRNCLKSWKRICLFLIQQNTKLFK